MFLIIIYLSKNNKRLLTCDNRERIMLVMRLVRIKGEVHDEK